MHIQLDIPHSSPTYSFLWWGHRQFSWIGCTSTDSTSLNSNTRCSSLVHILFFSHQSPLRYFYPCSVGPYKTVCHFRDSAFSLNFAQALLTQGWSTSSDCMDEHRMYPETSSLACFPDVASLSTASRCTCSGYHQLHDYIFQAVGAKLVHCYVTFVCRQENTIHRIVPVSFNHGSSFHV